MVRARYFDGRSSRAREVVLSRQAGQLALDGDGVALRVAPGEVDVSEPLARTGRILALPGGARCEVAPGPELDLLLELLGHREGRVARWQANLRVALVCAALVLALLAAGYRWGLPWLAASVARALPEEWVQRIGAHTLAALDDTAFEASGLDPERTSRLAARLAALRAPPGGLPRYSLHFRSSALGANAFALPGGEIVVTDALVRLAHDDDELIGVLAHELGHLRERHALRGLIQASVVGMLVAAWVGDVGTFASALPAFVLEAGYSRDFEREADAYAARVLDANGQDTSALANLLARLESSRGGPQAGSGLSAYLSSHPTTVERIRALGEGGAAGVSRPE